MGGAKCKHTTAFKDRRIADKLGVRHHQRAKGIQTSTPIGQAGVILEQRAVDVGWAIGIHPAAIDLSGVADKLGVAQGECTLSKQPTTHIIRRRVVLEQAAGHLHCTGRIRATAGRRRVGEELHVDQCQGAGAIHPAAVVPSHIAILHRKPNERGRPGQLEDLRRVATAHAQIAHKGRIHGDGLRRRERTADGDEGIHRQRNHNRVAVLCRDHGLPQGSRAAVGGVIHHHCRRRYRPDQQQVHDKRHARGQHQRRDAMYFGGFESGSRRNRGVSLDSRHGVGDPYGS